MKIKSKIALTISILAAVGAAVFLIFTNRDGFTGNRVKNPNEYLLKIEEMNGSDSHSMEFSAKTVLWVEFKAESGSLKMSITASDGTEIYSDDGSTASNFAVTLPEDGGYTVFVKAKHAKGKIYIAPLSA